MITNCLNNSRLLKLYPDVCVANYGSTHKGGLSLLLPFPMHLKMGKWKACRQQIRSNCTCWRWRLFIINSQGRKLLTWQNVFLERNQMQLTHRRDIPKWQILKQSQNKSGIASFTAGKVQVEQDYLRKAVVGRGELSYCQFSVLLIKKYYNNAIGDFGKRSRGKCEFVFPEFK